jgi:hypothetical protein
VQSRAGARTAGFSIAVTLGLDSTIRAEPRAAVCETVSVVFLPEQRFGKRVPRVFQAAVGALSASTAAAPSTAS